MGVLTSLGVVAILFFYHWPRQTIRGQKILTRGLLLVCIAVAIIGARYYLSARSDSAARREGDLVDRVEKMLYFRISLEGGWADDPSILARVQAQQEYLTLIKERPLVGHGFGSDIYYMETGVIYLSAHSSALRSAMEYGILYPIVIIFMFLALYYFRSRPLIEAFFQTNAVGQFVLSSIVLFLYAAVIDTRPFYVVLGIFSAALTAPRSLFRYNPAQDHICGYLNRQEVARLKDSVVSR